MPRVRSGDERVRPPSNSLIVVACAFARRVALGHGTVSVDPSRGRGRPSLILSARLSTVLRTALVSTAALLVLGSGVATAGDPAVQEANFRFIGNYDYIHVNSDDVFRFTAPATPDGVGVEVDVDAGGFTGIYTMPISDELGVRMIGGPTFSKVHVDGLDDLQSYGLMAGGDVFWRDPALGELGVGTFYNFAESERFRSTSDFRSVDRSDHTAGLHAYGKFFIKDLLGFGPVDLDASGNFSDSNIDDNGSLSAERNYGARWGATLYPGDGFSVRVGGRYSRTNYGDFSSQELTVMDLDAKVLIPSKPNVILGAGFFMGTTEESPTGFQNYGRFISGIAISATISFPGADSLVDLNRRFF